MESAPGRLPGDYDRDPARFAANQRATARFSRVGDVHPMVAARLAEAGDVELVADLGGGPGRLATELAGHGIRTVVVDRARHVEQAPRPAVRADLYALPLADGCVDAAACLWVLYHVEDPLRAMAEAARVLRPGGWFVAATSARSNDPELVGVLPGWGRPTTFDAEEAPELVARVFTRTETTRWDAPLVHLPDRAAATLFLRGRGLDEQQAGRAAAELSLPMDVTKRGALIWARAPGQPGLCA